MILFFIKEEKLNDWENLLNEDLTADLKSYIQSLATSIKVKLMDKSIRKYRVEVQYPKRKNQEPLGHYLPGTVYVFASSKQEAEEKAINWLKTSLDPDRIPHGKLVKNYLSRIKKRYVKPKAKEVRNWNDFVDLIKHLTTVKGAYSTPLYYVDDIDVEIFLRKAHQDKNFINTLNHLSPNEIKFIRKMYRDVATNIDNMSDNVRKLFDQTLNIDLSRAKGWNTTPFEYRSAWPYWSVFEPKDPNYDFEKELTNKKTVKEVLEMARKFGISKKELDSEIKDIYSHKDQWNQLEREFYKFLKSKFGMSSKKFAKTFEGSDYTDKRLEKMGIHFDMIANEILYSNEGWSQIIPFHAPQNDNDRDVLNVDYDALQNWVWDFYMNGEPRKVPTINKYKNCLKNMLLYRQEIKNRDSQVPF